jgi:ParB/RepB/Spo0J family partition protein
MENFMESIELEKIISESNRKYTLDENFGPFLESIQVYGILEPPIVRRLEGGLFRVMAGRRRIAAAREAGIRMVDCLVREADDHVEDEEIALLENVNRLDMHPLDEAALFSRMHEQGEPVEEIARYYARGPSAIYARIRLSKLTGDLKNLFRDGKLNISSAAALAELPKEDQLKFYEKHKDQKAISIWDIGQFFSKCRHHPVSDILGSECDSCKKRTRNTVDALFEEYKHLDDVCLDGECYAKKWHAKIGEALKEAAESYGELLTDKKIFFYSGIPKDLYRLADKIKFGGEEYEVLKPKDWDISYPETKGKKACWYVDIERDGKNKLLTVTRHAYKKRAPEKTKTAPVPVKKKYELYGGETMETLAAERGETPEKLAEELDEKKLRPYDLSSRIRDSLCDWVVSGKLTEDTKTNYVKIYFTLEFAAGNAKAGAADNFFRGEKNRDLFKWIFGVSSIDDLKISGETQKFFHFLLLEESDTYPSSVERMIPDIEDIEEPYSDLFFEYAGISRDKYRELWRGIERRIILETLETGEKKPGKKKTVSPGKPGDGREGE